MTTPSGKAMFQMFGVFAESSAQLGRTDEHDVPQAVEPSALIGVYSVHFEDEPGRRSGAHLMTRDEARPTLFSNLIKPNVRHERQQEVPSL